MSRYIINRGNLEIAYGWDEIPTGYFFQVFDTTKVTDDSEGIIVNEGFMGDINNKRMLKLMDEYEVSGTLKIEIQRQRIKNNLPI